MRPTLSGAPWAKAEPAPATRSAAAAARKGVWGRIGMLLCDGKGDWRTRRPRRRKRPGSVWAAGGGGQGGFLAMTPGGVPVAAPSLATGLARRYYPDSM